MDDFGEISPRAVDALRAATNENARLRDVMFASTVALQGYHPDRAPVPILFLRAQERHRVLDEDAAAWWAQRTTAALAAHPVPGDHFSCMEPPNVSEVARLVLAQLAADEGAALEDAARIAGTVRASLDPIERTDRD